ncbi:MAG: hypothetical protein F6K10_04045 [Moorea sp. SIO2B7]|nr:hypothetical protein [Moorena sp. SIO2B7]
MVAILKPKFPKITESKINHKSAKQHRLARFVREETVALMFNLNPEEIYRIECWRHVVYVHGKGVSRFVSYADFPPILGVTPPNKQDFPYWRRRWYKSAKSHYAPEFWTKFYIQQFKQASSAAQLLEWGQLLALFKYCLSQAALQQLREVYSYERELWQNF